MLVVGTADGHIGASRLSLLPSAGSTFNCWPCTTERGNIAAGSGVYRVVNQQVEAVQRLQPNLEYIFILGKVSSFFEGVNCFATLDMLQRFDRCQWTRRAKIFHYLYPGRVVSATASPTGVAE